MKQYNNSVGDVVILERGEELISALETYADENKLASAWLQSGLGGSGSVTLSFYNFETREYVDKVFDEPLEILSLQGNVSWVDEKPFWHVHGVFGTRNYGTIGGHVKELTIALTAELFVAPLKTPLTRKLDDTTGLKLLEQAEISGGFIA